MVEATQTLPRRSKRATLGPERDMAAGEPGLGQEDVLGAAALTGTGMRVTVARLAIVSALRRNGAPMSALALFKALQDRQISQTLGTVYNTVKSLRAAGIVVVHTDAARRQQFSLNEASGLTVLSCRYCESSVEIDDHPRATALVEQQCKTLGIPFRGFKLSIHWVCERCAREQPRKPVFSGRSPLT